MFPTSHKGQTFTAHFPIAGDFYWFFKDNFFCGALETSPNGTKDFPDWNCWWEAFRKQFFPHRFSQGFLSECLRKLQETLERIHCGKMRENERNAREWQMPQCLLECYFADYRTFTFSRFFTCVQVTFINSLWEFTFVRAPVNAAASEYHNKASTVSAGNFPFPINSFSSQFSTRFFFSICNIFPFLLFFTTLNDQLN